MKTVRLLFICVLFLSLSSSISLAEEKNYGLQELIQIAFEKNPTAAIFSANIESGKGSVGSSKAYPNPEIEIAAGSGKSLGTSYTGGEYSITIGQPIERPSKRLFRRKAAEAAVEVAEKEAEDFHLELVYEVKKAFYRLLLARKELEVASENLKTVEDIHKTIEVRVRAGEAPELELVKAQVESLKAEKDVKKAGTRIPIARASLHAVLGGALKADFDVEGEFSLTDKDSSLDTLLKSALENHPRIVRARKELRTTGYALERERASVFPDISVKGFIVKEVDREALGVGLSIPLPLWYQRKGEISAASAEKDKAVAELERVKVELSRAISEEFQNYTIALDQLEVFEKGLLKQASEALRIAELSYRHGESGLLDYLDAQRVYRQTRLEYYQAFYELEVAIASLERVAGFVFTAEALRR